MTMRTRFAPSPTGVLHIGGVRTALFNWLLARRYGGAFVLRIEDTDTERSTRESIAQIIDAMSWLGLEADEGPFLQTDRLDRYRAVARQLLEAGLAYRCYCSREELAAMREDQRSRGLKPRYDGRCRTRTDSVPGVDAVVRFKTPEGGLVRVRDLIRGEVTFDNSELDDLVILRSDGFPTYNFSVVVDDSDMGITHVVRGDDHLNNTPRQINILNALGLRLPEYAHVPMILGSDGGRLSKRHGAVNVTDYREAGYLPEAVLNYMVRLGWSHGDQELFEVDEMIGAFSLEQVNESAAAYDPDKFLWVNEQWLRRAPTARLSPLLATFLEGAGMEGAAQDAGPPLEEIVEIQRHRARTLVEMAEKSRFVYNEPDTYAPKAAKQHLRGVALPVLQRLRKRLGELSEWSVETTQTVVESVAEELDIKMGKVAQPLRVAVTGEAASPGIGQTLALIGRAKTLRRLAKAVEFVEARIARTQ
ncbi:MAG: glutamate--tRNA ligase [Proteobacteria bacterium]|nr:glutamate--tRNA ligase [Pseudomonadota bacterium]